jgi:predicted ArsR family transcriptional regulator
MRAPGVDDSVHLSELRDAAGYRDLVERMINSAVFAARQEGATWAQIADALGVSHQAARKRFRALCEDRNGVPRPAAPKALVGGDLG